MDVDRLHAERLAGAQMVTWSSGRDDTNTPLADVLGRGAQSGGVEVFWLREVAVGTGRGAVEAQVVVRLLQHEVVIRRSA